jgi:hypothetical protein
MAAFYSGLDVDTIYREICRYNAKDSAILTDRLRSIIGIDMAVERIEQLYTDAIRKYNASVIDPKIEAHAMSLYLKNITILLKQKYKEVGETHQELVSMEDSKSNVYHFYKTYFKPLIPRVFFDIFNYFKIKFSRVGNNESINEGKGKEKFPESALAHKYLDGLKGIEIGGSAHNSFGLNTRNVDYSDDMTNVFKQEEMKMYGEVMKVDLVASGDVIPVPDESEDFIISSHVIEHFPDPIKALKEWYRIIKPGGYIFIIAPHKERTFDKDRERTTLQELIQRHALSVIPEIDNHAHYSVWITQDLIDLINYLGWNIVVVQDIDDKVGNGFTIVIQK